MNFASLTDLIRPVGSVYFCNNAWNFNPTNLFGGVWVNSGQINISDETINVWHRTE